MPSKVKKMSVVVNESGVVTVNVDKLEMVAMVAYEVQQSWVNVQYAFSTNIGEACIGGIWDINKYIEARPVGLELAWKTALGVLDVNNPAPLCIDDQQALEEAENGAQSVTNEDYPELF